MIIAKKTDIGKVRRTNQDACAAGEFPGGLVWAVVCDGMGGAAGGDIASTTAVKIISEKISDSFTEGMSTNSIRELLFSAIETANSVVFDMSQSNPELDGMGTTVVAAVINAESVFIAHVGDSRAYKIFDDTLLQLTRDHSVVQEMVESGELTPSEAKIDPRKNIITRALGVDDSVLIDFCEETFKQGDTLLICTDGLSNFVETEDILRLIKNEGDAQCADKLVELANENGGRDNITAVTVSY